MTVDEQHPCPNCQGPLEEKPSHVMYHRVYDDGRTGTGEYFYVFWCAGCRKTWSPGRISYESSLLLPG